MAVQCPEIERRSAPRWSSALRGFPSGIFAGGVNTSALAVFLRAEGRRLGGGGCASYGREEGGGALGCAHKDGSMKRTSPLVRFGIVSWCEVMWCMLCM